ncbi:class GN sortase [Shewanella zhangzhouensis]|nr:class GN sortase [Shewanella zhangzhouensis]
MKRFRFGSRPRRRWPLLLLSGVVLISFGGYMQAKALLAQYLIASAWEQSLKDGLPHKPWGWADTYPIARLELRREGASSESFYILAGANGRNLAFAPGWLEETAAPGDGGNTVIAGHRDTHFAILREVGPGDELLLENMRGELQQYRVKYTSVVSERELSVLEQVTDRLTLITCYPFYGLSDRANERFVVVAEPDDLWSRPDAAAKAMVVSLR